jgi:hypothetical protein
MCNCRLSVVQYRNSLTLIILPLPFLPFTPTGIRLEETKKINRSIAAFGNCIAARALKDQQRQQQQQRQRNKHKQQQRPVHVPYRDSPLTRLLEVTLSGNTHVTLVANVGPSVYVLN